MNIGEPQKVTEEPRPIRAPNFTPNRRIPMPVFPEREKVPVGVPRRPPEREREKAAEVGISFYESLSGCPYCGSDLEVEDGEWGQMLVCPRHGVLGAA